MLIFSNCSALLTGFVAESSKLPNQPDYVEIWLEKDALAGVVYTITERWDVPLYVTRGYPSLSYLYDAAEYLKASEASKLPSERESYKADAARSFALAGKKDDALKIWQAMPLKLRSESMMVLASAVVPPLCR